MVEQAAHLNGKFRRAQELLVNLKASLLDRGPKRTSRMGSVFIIETRERV
jgi:hypothetical protein